MENHQYGALLPSNIMPNWRNVPPSVLPAEKFIFSHAMIFRGKFFNVFIEKLPYVGIYLHALNVINQNFMYLSKRLQSSTVT